MNPSRRLFRPSGFGTGVALDESEETPAQSGTSSLQAGSMTGILSRAWPRVSALRLRAQSTWWMWRLRNLEAASLRGLSLGNDNWLGRPVTTGGGHGRLIVGSRNYLGATTAPCVGDGALMFQPRAESSLVEIGDGNWISNNVVALANERISIGNGCQIGDLVCIYDCDFHEVDPQTRIRSPGVTSPVRVGNNVWLGSRVMVLKGVTIGDNSVVAAMSVVVHSIPPDSIAAGVPARVLRQINQP